MVGGEVSGNTRERAAHVLEEQEKDRGAITTEVGLGVAACGWKRPAGRAQGRSGATMAMEKCTE